MPETLAQKRQAAIQKLLYRLLELIMLDKLRHANSESGVSRRTKDYVDQVIQAARFTDIEEDIRRVPVHHAGRVLAALAGKERCGKRYRKSARLCAGSVANVRRRIDAGDSLNLAFALEPLSPMKSAKC